MSDTALVLFALPIGAIATVVLMLSGCAPAADSPPKTDAERYAAFKAFSIDGCDVYQFTGKGGYIHYLAKCEHAVPSEVLSRQTCGKACTRPAPNSTEQKQK